MSISYTESMTGLIDAADLFVHIRKKMPLVPPPQRYAHINVLGKKKTSGSDLNGEILTPSNQSAQSNNIQEMDELNFVGSIKVWNTETLTQAIVNDMRAYGETLVVLSGQTEAVKNNSTLDFGQMIIWFTQTSSATTLDTIVSQAHRGAFIDTEKKGKCLFALSHLLQDATALQYSTQIQTTTLKGITDPALASQLDHAGYSYFFRTRDLCWPRGFWIGRSQARSVYADRSVIYDVKLSIAQLVQQGLEMSTSTLALLESRILNTIKTNRFVTRLHGISIPQQRAIDVTRGVIAGIRIAYETAQEVRTVTIDIGGDV